MKFSPYYFGERNPTLDLTFNSKNEMKDFYHNREKNELKKIPENSYYEMKYEINKNDGKFHLKVYYSERKIYENIKECLESLLKYQKGEDLLYESFPKE